MLLVELISFVLTREMLILLMLRRLLLRTLFKSWRARQRQGYNGLSHTLTFRFGYLMTLLVLVFCAERNSDSTVAVIFLRVRIDNSSQSGRLLGRSRGHHDRLLVQRCGIVLLLFALVRQRLQRWHWSVQHDTILFVLVVLDVEYLHLFLLLLLVGKQWYLCVVRC